MNDIALAGFVLTVEEWQQLDAAARAQLVAAIMQWDDPLVGLALEAAVDAVPVPTLARGSQPAIAIPGDLGK